MKFHILILALFYSFTFSFTLSTQAQIIEQTIILQPGWNAVYLEIQPIENQSDTVFSGIPIESVWYWNKQFSTIQYIQDPNSLIPEEPDWLNYFPPSSDTAFATDLFRIDGGKPYLIKLLGDQPFTWNIQGTPAKPDVEWIGDSFNFVGFNVDPDNLPSFQTYFQPSNAHSGQEIYRLNQTGDWVLTNSNDLMNPGEAFWIYSNGESTFEGPVEVLINESNEIDFDTGITEYSIEIHNPTNSLKSITVQQEESQQLSNNTMPYSGPVPLSYYERNLGARIREWVNFDQPLTITVLPGQTEIVEIAVRRPDMAAPLSSSLDATYQSILTINDNEGFEAQYPITAKNRVQTNQSLSFGPNQNLPTNTLLQPGLWVGTASINAVNQPASNLNPSVPQPTSSEFQLRLIIHVDSNGIARLLQQVFLMWKDGTRVPDANNPNNTVLAESGRMVLLTDENLINQYSGSTLRNGEQVGKRLSSAAFSFQQPIEMVVGSESLSCQILLDYDDPQNPFKHRYHPDHNNLTERFDAQLPEGVESYTVIRELGLEFTEQDPEELALSGWGDTHVGGIYSEKITGIHRDVLQVEGIFRLTKAVDVEVLNDDQSI